MAVFVMNNGTSLTNNNTDHLECAKCGELTVLRVLMPTLRPGYEERFFECPFCRHPETLFIKL